jgi:hypothetical protein
MNEGCQCRIEQTSGSQANANHIDRDRPGEVLQDNPSRQARDLQRFGELGQVVAQQDHIRCLTIHFAYIYLQVLK